MRSRLRLPTPKPGGCPVTTTPPLEHLVASLHVEQQGWHHAHRLLPLHSPLLSLADEPRPEAVQTGVATLALERRARHVELPRYMGLQLGYTRLQD